MSKKAQKKSQDKSLESKPNKEEDAAEVQRCIERLRELLQGNFEIVHCQIVCSVQMKEISYHHSAFNIAKSTKTIYTIFKTPRQFFCEPIHIL
jgi:hypothetical protein